MQRVVNEELTDDTPIKQELMELQMRLEMGEIDDAEYRRARGDPHDPSPRSARVARAIRPPDAAAVRSASRVRPTNLPNQAMRLATPPPRRSPASIVLRSGVTALYAYAIVPASLDPTTAPSGIDDGPVVTVRAGDIAALVTPIDEAAYDPELVAARSQDLTWLGARAAAHDRVITWAVDLETVIPLPLFSLFRDSDGVRRMLARRGAELGSDAARYRRRPRVHRASVPSGRAAPGRAGRAEPEVAELEARASNASPGQRYLLERKLDQTRREELERVGRETADEVFAALGGIARATARDPVASQPAAAGHAVLNAAFLVAVRDVEAFRSTVTQLVERRGPEGFRFEFTGPWAPYHFVRTPGDGQATRRPSTPRDSPGSRCDRDAARDPSSTRPAWSPGLHLASRTVGERSTDLAALEASTADERRLVLSDLLNRVLIAAS